MKLSDRIHVRLIIFLIHYFDIVGVFQVFQIVQMVPNRATHHK